MERKYEIDTRENIEFLTEVRKDLFDFGRAFPSPEGSSYALGIDGKPILTAPKETYVTSRMCHAYSMGKILGYPGSEELAKEALRGLRGELRDRKNGGWFPGINADGTPVPDKLCYAHAFVILAATSLINAGIEGGEELLEDAKREYDKYFWDEKDGKSYDFWNTEFTKLDPYRGANANMHTVEAFLAVADTTGNEEYRKRAGRIIDFISACAEKNNWRIPEHFTEKWELDLDKNKENPDDPFKPYGATPGHGIEWSRLIIQWALSTFEEDEPVIPYLRISENLYNRAIEDAWGTDGVPGLAYTTDFDGKPIVRDRMHWTVCEAINTSALLYRITRKEKYANDYAMFWEYSDKYLIDHEQGSWFHQLGADNKVALTVWPCKMDIYHALQATIIPYCKASISVCKAISM